MTVRTLAVKCAFALILMAPFLTSVSKDSPQPWKSAAYDRINNLYQRADSIERLDHSLGLEAYGDVSRYFFKNDTFLVNNLTPKAYIEAKRIALDAILYQSSTNFFQGKILQAYKWLDTGDSLVWEHRDKIPSQYAKFKVQRSYYQLFEGKSANAIALALEAVRTAKKINDLTVLGDAYHCLGRVHFQQNRDEDALASWQKALEAYRKSACYTGKANILNEIGRVYTKQNQIGTAVNYYRSAIEQYHTANDCAPSYDIKRNMNMVIGNLAGDLIKLGKLEEAEKYLAEAEQVRLDLMESSSEPSLHSIRGNLMLAKKDTAKAILQYEKAYKVALKINDVDQLANFPIKISNLLEKTGNTKSALFYFKEHKRWNDSLMNANAQKNVFELQTAFEQERQEKDMVLLKQKNQALNYRSSTYGIIAILTTLLGITLALFLNKKKRLSQEEKRNMEIKYHLAQENIKTQEADGKKLRDNFENQSTKLKESLLSMNERYILLKDIRDKLKTIKGLPDTSRQKEIASMLNWLNHSISILNKEEYLNQVTGEVGDRFMERLGNQYPNLNQTEKTILCLIALNRSSGDISVLLDISKKAVEMKRYRLRKKLNLDSAQDLREAIEKIKSEAPENEEKPETIETT
ncbi:hypothetical protein FUAX_27150 [Fulvitalea axinellae]|uniref:HTH luxR-type domain-containing protein n=2 Tax=Fulvitalea axinellae TaxID=1182444 RepID=A0AAU9D2U8_9BACT|nr:hypothetical protein FUAX_27150 [Fulvitalea axinellae]